MLFRATAEAFIKGGAGMIAGTVTARDISRSFRLGDVLRESLADPRPPLPPNPPAFPTLGVLGPQTSAELSASPSVLPTPLVVGAGFSLIVASLALVGVLRALRKPFASRAGSFEKVPVRACEDGDNSPLMIEQDDPLLEDVELADGSGSPDHEPDCPLSGLVVMAEPRAEAEPAAGRRDGSEQHIGDGGGGGGGDDDDGGSDDDDDDDDDDDEYERPIIADDDDECAEEQECGRSCSPSADDLQQYRGMDG